MFPSSRWRSFGVLLAFSDCTDCPQILLCVSELGAPAPVCSPVCPAVQVKGSPSLGGQQQLVLRGCWKDDSRQPARHSVTWKSPGSRVNPDCDVCWVVWAGTADHRGPCRRLCWKRGRPLYSRPTLLSCSLRVGSQEVMSYVHGKRLWGQ